jgi:hypothetical protein
MNEFRKALDAHIAGQIDLKAVERALHESLVKQPNLAAAHGAIVEAMYRSTKIPGEAYLALIQVVRGFQQQVSRPTTPPPAPSPPPSPAGSATGDSDKTQFRPRPVKADTPPATPTPPEDADKTKFRPRPPAPQAPVSTPPSHVSVPPSAPHTPFTGGESSSWRPPTTGTTSGTGRSGGSWSDPRTWAVADAAPLTTGSVIKDRFILEDELGRGGMGIVFKARDLRKEEAQDRNPYVAIKVLNEEFKRHPESLKALQREARKAQNLAHPNVVTVYDFDRDGPNVYMVMELLEGEALDRVIKRADGVGLGVKEALRITRDICRAMAYAHDQGIVHSDFKPGNAFLTKDGVVKVFDFGIARAAKRSDHVTGSTTLFDPGTLGALTPAYASCEMIEGLEPDPRDDVYAIACVTYEMLAGSHPFNRMSAVQARDNNMVPKQPPGLSRQQWRALQRGLAFNREQRLPSAMAFLNAILPPKRQPTVYIGAAAAAAVLVVLAVTVVPGQIAAYRERSLAEALASASADRIEPVLPDLKAMTSEKIGTLLSGEAPRRGLIRYYEDRMNAAVDSTRGRYDYPRAESLLAELRGFLPDSQIVNEIGDRLIARKNDEIKRQNDLFDQYLSRGLLIPAQGNENIGAVLAVVRQIDPQSSLLRDPRLPSAYAQQAAQALKKADPTLADALVQAGLAFQPDDAALADLRDQVTRALTAAQLAARRNSLQQSLVSLVSPQTTLEEIDARRSEISELRTIDAQNSVLARVQEVAQRAVAAASADLVKNRNFTGAQELVARYTDVVSPTFVAEQRQQIAAARGAFETRLARISDSITEAIRQRRLGANVRNSAEQGLRELEQAGAPADTLSIARDRIAQAYVQAAHESQQRQDWAGARQYIAGGTALKPSAPVAAALQDAAKEIDNAERLARAQLDAEARRQLLAQQQKEENDLRAQLAAGLKQPNLSLDDARRLAGIADRLTSRGVRDPAVTNAKTELQNALARQVAALSKANDFDAAVKLAEGAFALFPTSTIAKRSLDDARAASQQHLVAQRESAAAEIKSKIDAHLKNRKIDDAWDAELKRQLRQLSAYVPANDPYVARTRTSAARIYLEQARTLRSSQRLTEAGRMLERAREYAPSLADLASEEKLLAEARARVEAETRERSRLANIQAAKQRLLVQAKANEVQEAQATLKELQSVLPANDAFLTTEGPQAIGAAYLRLASTAAKDGRFKNAVELAERGAQVVPNVPALAAASKRYARYMAIDEDLATRNRIEVIRIRRELSELAKEDPSEAQAISQRIARNFVQRISSVSPSLGGNLARAAMEIFPNDPLVSSLREQAIEVVRRGGSVTPTPRETPRETTPRETTPRETAPARATIAEPSSTPAAGSASPPPQEQPQAAASAQRAGASGTEDACTANLAGYGRRRQGICSDPFEGGRGPELVVVPAGGPITKPFAIGRTEVSVAEYALYCTRSGRCTPPTGPGQQPITGISIADAERYTQWLTQVTGFTYRLPTGEEWTYAANAGTTGAATDSNSVNCVVELGGKKIRGTTLDVVQSGSSNRWGLYHYVGNVQEWTRSGSTITARGGAFTDSVSMCTTGMSRPHSGNPDPVTGFRVVRELK